MPPGSEGTLPMSNWVLRSGLILGFALARAALAGELLPPEGPIEVVVDHHVDAGLAAAGTKAAPVADDATIVRRVTLDLVGRVPTAGESRAYVESTDPDKRVKLVDRLIESPGFARHQAESLDAMMMAGLRSSLRDYLLTAARENRPWDRVFREVMAANEAEPAAKGSSEFLKGRAKDTDRLTTDVSSIFFGVNVSCAKCHDHPLVDDWKQDHYYGMKSFLDRTFAAGEFVAEHGYGSVKFKTVEGQEKKAKFLFLTGKEVEVGGPEELAGDAKKAEKEKLAEAKKKNEAPPAPEVSARGRLVEVALGPDGREFFSRSIVNRTWHRFFGQGLVMPLDQMHSENPPSHPELLEWLARDAVEHGYDLRRLARGLGPEPRLRPREPGRVGKSRPSPVRRRLALGRSPPCNSAPRCGSPRPTRASCSTPATSPRSRPSPSEAGGWPGRSPEARRRLPDRRRRGAPDQQRQQARRASSATAADRLLGRLLKITDRRERVEVAVRNVLSRPADEEEIALLEGFLDRRADRPVEGTRHLVWALLAGGEFRFNH